MRVEIVSVDRNDFVQIGAELFGYRGRFRSPLVSGVAVLVSISGGLEALVEGSTIDGRAEHESVSNFRVVPSFDTPRIEALSEPGDYAVVGTALDVQSYIQVGDWLFQLNEESMGSIVPREGQRVAFTLHGLWLWDFTASVKLHKSFGPFSSSFIRDDGVRVMACLDLLTVYQDPASASALDLISDALQADDWESYAIKLLEDPNWRRQLIAGCALLYIPSKKVLPTLWNAIDAGSWVTPQLAVVGYLSDVNFVEHAKSRIEAGCPVSPPQGLSDIERLSATGSAGSTGRSAKNLASLLFMCAQTPELSSWCEETRASPKIAALLKKDFDDSAAITERWFEGITQLFKDRRVTLSPACLSSNEV